MGLQPGRKNQVLAECRRIFVNREAGTIRCNLEQHPTRLEKVDGLEPEPVDDFSRSAASAIDSLAYLELRFVIRYAPGHMMYSAGSPASAICFSDFASLQVASRTAAANR